MMSLWPLNKWHQVRATLLGCCLSVSTLDAGAVVMAITATFNPDPSNPRHNTFRNTTRSEGFCRDQPEICKTHNILSLNFGGVPHNGPIQPDHTDVRAGAMIKTPAACRSLQVTDQVTGETAIVEVRIAGMGGTYEALPSVGEITGEGNWWSGHAKLWGSNWQTAPSPCVGIGVNSVSHTAFYFFWLTPEETICAKQAKFLIPSFGYRYSSFSYELRTPDPLKMSTGVYVGTQVYSVGRGGDFDLGDITIPHDTTVQLDFTLTVEHTLKVEIPPGGHRVELLPQGGWQAWLNQGSRPARLFRDQTFNLSASSRFKMNLECQHHAANTCALHEPVSGHTVPMNIAVSLPNGMTDALGQSINRRPLLRDGSGTELFQPRHYVDRKPATLHFEVAREEVEEMLDGSGKTYSGNVTVVWDSEV
ncbi:hypothetical protein [Pseudomonas sp. LT1P18]|uniref:hypothetical protein n=1 Tax=Pseudomonas arabinosi TaxID=3398357 RepID=UPI0039EDF40D